MENNMQPIEGGIISSIAKLLFGGGLDKLLGEAAEYEEEMGVLKQVTRLAVEDPKTHDRYELKIKLSPVKDKESFFYVEAECDAPNLDLSSINDKAMKIDKSNIEDFNSKIDKLLTDNGLEPRYSKDEKEKEDQTDETKDEETDEAEGNSIDSAVLNKVKSVFNSVNQFLSKKYYEATKDDTTIYIKAELNDLDDECNCTVVMTPLNKLESGKYSTIPGINSSEEDMSMLNDDREALEAKAIIALVTQYVNNYCYNMDPDLKVKSYPAKQIAEATFVKNKNGDVELTAIHASKDIKAAMDAVYDIIENDDFVDQLTEDAQSFVILDDGDTYDIEDTEEVVVDDNYLALFSETSRFHNILRTYAWAVGNQKWQNDTTFSSIMWPVSSFEDSCALWVVKHDSNQYPTPQCAYTDFPSFDLLRDEEGNISIEDVKSDVIDKTQNFLDNLEYYYVNLEHEEQKTVDDFINQIETILAYA